MKGVVNSFAIIKDQRSCPQRSTLEVNEWLKILQSGTRRWRIAKEPLPPCGLVHTQVIPPIRDLISLSQKSENGCEGGEQAGKS